MITSPGHIHAAAAAITGGTTRQGALHATMLARHSTYQHTMLVTHLDAWHNHKYTNATKPLPMLPSSNQIQHMVATMVFLTWRHSNTLHQP